MTLDTIATAIAIIGGSGGIGAGAWKLAGGLYRKARAVEGWRDDVREGLQLLTRIAVDHEDRITSQEQRHEQTEHQQWMTHPNTTTRPPPLPPPVGTPSR